MVDAGPAEAVVELGREVRALAEEQAGEQRGRRGRQRARQRRERAGANPRGPRRLWSLERHETLGARRARDVDAVAREVRRVVEAVGVVEAGCRKEPQLGGDPLARCERRRRAVHGRLDQAHARRAVDALGRDQEARALGRPPDGRGGEPPLHVRDPRQLEPGDVVGRQRRRGAAQRPERRHAHQEGRGRPEDASDAEQRDARDDRHGPRRPRQVRTRPRGRGDAGSEARRHGHERHAVDGHSVILTIARRRSIVCRGRPRTRRRSSTAPKGPLASRAATMRAASAGPTPGRPTSSAAPA